jgi:hypothetical protein
MKIIPRKIDLNILKVLYLNQTIKSYKIKTQNELR